MSSVSGPHKTQYGTWEVRYREGEKHRSRTLKTRREAERFKAEVIGRVERGRGIMARRDVPTVREFAVRIVAGMRLANSTRRLYARLLEDHVLPELGHLSLLDLRPARLAEWQTGRLAAGAGPAVLGKAQTLLGQILNKAVLPHEYLDVNPILALDKPAYEKRSHRWLTAFEVEQIRMKYLEWGDVGSAALVSVLGYTGIRPQDALALDWADVGERLSVTKRNSDGQALPGGKTGDGYRRSVYLPPMVAADLTEWRGQTSSSSPLIFPRRSDGRPWTKGDFDNWRARRQSRLVRGERRVTKGRCFKLAAEDVGLGWSLRPYDLRHTAATLYIAAGWNHLQVARQLGHTPSQSMTTYQHLFDESAHSVERRAMNDYIREARGLAPLEAPITQERIHA